MAPWVILLYNRGMINGQKKFYITFPELLFFFLVTHVELYHKFTQINDEQLVIGALQFTGYLIFN